MLQKFIGKGKEKIGAFLSLIRVGGFTVASMLSTNRRNTVTTLYDQFKGAVMAEVGTESYSQALERAVKSRKRSTLMTLRNILSGVRGQARAILATGKSGVWANSSVLDGNTTEVCKAHVGRTWRMPYGQIENKPPRVPPQHPCRSVLLFREDGISYPEEKPFIDQFNADESLRRELLGAKRFEAYKSGKLTITSFAQFEKVVLTTLDDLGLQ